MKGQVVRRTLAPVVALGVLLLGHVCAWPADDHSHPGSAMEAESAAVHGDGLHAASCDGTGPGPPADTPAVLPTSRLPGPARATELDPRPLPVDLTRPPHLVKPPLLI